jgi:hypothetical protein
MRENNNNNNNNRRNADSPLERHGSLRERNKLANFRV